MRPFVTAIFLCSSCMLGKHMFQHVYMASNIKTNTFMRCVVFSFLFLSFYHFYRLLRTTTLGITSVMLKTCRKIVFDVIIAFVSPFLEPVCGNCWVCNTILVVLGFARLVIDHPTLNMCLASYTWIMVTHNYNYGPHDKLLVGSCCVVLLWTVSHVDPENFLSLFGGGFLWIAIIFFDFPLAETLLENQQSHLLTGCLRAELLLALPAALLSFHMGGIQGLVSMFLERKQKHQKCKYSWCYPESLLEKAQLKWFTHSGNLAIFSLFEFILSSLFCLLLFDICHCHMQLLPHTLLKLRNFARYNIPFLFRFLDWRILARLEDDFWEITATITAMKI